MKFHSYRSSTTGKLEAKQFLSSKMTITVMRLEPDYFKHLNMQL